MAFIAMAFIAVCFTIAAYYLKQVVLAVACTFGWLIIAAYGYITAAGDMTNIYFYVFFFGVAMTITMGFESLRIMQMSREYREDETEEREFKHKERTEPKEQLSKADKLRVKHGMTPRHRVSHTDRSGW